MAQPDNKKSNDKEQKIFSDIQAVSDAAIDLIGLDSKLQRALSILEERVKVLEAKTVSMPLLRPVTIPQKQNYNTDYVEGM